MGHQSSKSATPWYQPKIDQALCWYLENNKILEKDASHFKGTVQGKEFLSML
jgi:hypothetical protein